MVRRRIKEAFYIAGFRPELNKQVLSPWEQVLHNLVLPELKELWSYADFSTLMMINQIENYNP